MRLRSAIGTLAVMLTAAAGVLLGHATSAHAAAAGDLGVQVHGDDAGRPVVTLTNTGTQPCQVVPVAEGTVVLTRVEQDGKPVEPIPIIPSYDDDLGYQLSQRLVSLVVRRRNDQRQRFCKIANGIVRFFDQPQRKIGELSGPIA